MKRKSKIITDHEMHRSKILKAAGEMVAEEGLEQISIRKLATKIEYSPTVIYHYFKNKDELITALTGRGYGEMLDKLRTMELQGNPRDKLSCLIQKHIELVMEIPELYKNIQLSSVDEIRSRTSFLHSKAATEKPMLGVLADQISEILGKDKQDSIVEQTAQIIAVSIFGLEMRMITEQIGEPQRSRLIKQFTRMMCNSVEQMERDETKEDGLDGSMESE